MSSFFLFVDISKIYTSRIFIAGDARGLAPGLCNRCPTPICFQVSEEVTKSDTRSIYARGFEQVVYGKGASSLIFPSSQCFRRGLGGTGLQIYVMQRAANQLSRRRRLPFRISPRAHPLHASGLAKMLLR
jgi:hypothetical protein